MNITSLHASAVQLAGSFRQVERELLDVLVRLDGARAFGVLGYPSCFDYCLKALGLSEAQSYYFSRVARKAQEVPELKAAVDSGKLTLSQARRIVPVVNPSNAAAWVEKAAVLPQRQLEREVAAVNPEAFPQERIRPVGPGVSELKVAISHRTESLLRRLKDLKPGASTDELLAEALESLLARRDPVKRAERAKPSTVKPSGSRKIPAGELHKVHRRDGGRCQAVLPSGNRCGAMRFLQIHHKKHWALGGAHDAQNLETLCSAHHRAHHSDGFLRKPALGARVT